MTRMQYPYDYQHDMTGDVEAARTIMDGMETLLSGANMLRKCAACGSEVRPMEARAIVSVVARQGNLKNWMEKDRRKFWIHGICIDPSCEAEYRLDVV